MSYVLVVDDEEPVRRLLRRQLEALGYKVREAPSATETLEMLLSAVIMATVADDIPSIERSRKLGAVDYVLKPFDRELLRQALQRAEAAPPNTT